MRRVLFDASRDPGQQQRPEERDPAQCHATGCPCRATVSLGGGPAFCSHHAWADFDSMPKITRALADHDWMIGLMRDLHTMHRAGKTKQAVEFAREFFADARDYPGMQPTDHEAKHFAHYLYRLHLDLGWRVGARTHQPSPMVPQGQTMKPLRHRDAPAEVE